VQENSLDNRLGFMQLLESVVDVRDCTGSEDQGNKGEEGMVLSPKSEPDSIEDGDENKVPTNSKVDLIVDPLVNDQTTEQEVNHAPDVKGKGSWGDVRLVLGVIRRVLVLVTTKGGVQVSSQQGQVYHDVGDLGRPVMERETHV